MSWLGGEPLLWAPLEQLTPTVRSLGLEISTTTNGTTLGSSRIRQHLCELYNELTISIDGFADFHDPMRGWVGGFNKLRTWIPALASQIHAQRSSLKLRANVVLMRQNAGDFPALRIELAHWGIEEITFNQLGGRDRPEFYPTHRLRTEDIDAMVAASPTLRHELLKVGTSLVGGQNYLKRIYASARDERNPIDDCGPGEEFLFIDERGRISPCSFTSHDYGIDIRSVNTSADVKALAGRFRAMQRSKRSAQCDDCLSTQVCDKFKRPMLASDKHTNADPTRGYAL